MTTLLRPEPADSSKLPTLDHADARLASVLAPIAPRHNAHQQIAHRQLREWVRDFGLLARPDLARRFWQADFPGFVALTYPTAAGDALSLVADWFAWLFILDDTLDDGPTGRDPSQTGELMAELADVVHRPATVTDSPRPTRQPLVAALADLWVRTTSLATAHWVDRFVHHMTAGIAAAAWEAGNRASGVVPAPDCYIEQRRHTGAVYVCMDLIDAIDRLEVPPDVYAQPAFQDTLAAACDVVCWTNDLYSFDKETQLGEFHNLVSVVAHHRRLAIPEATQVAGGMVATRVGEFFDHERRLLARMSHLAPVASCLAGMRAWMRGNFDWSRITLRYRDSAARWTDA